MFIAITAQQQPDYQFHSRKICDKLMYVYGRLQNACRTLCEVDNAMKTYVIRPRDMGQTLIYRRHERRECIQKQNMVYRKRYDNKCTEIREDLRNDNYMDRKRQHQTT